MATHKRIDGICIAAVVLAIVSTVLLMNDRALGIVPVMSAEGRELLSEEIPCSFSSAVISTPVLKVGDICTIENGGAQGLGNTLILLGISILVLLSGLFTAMKIEPF